MTAVLGNHKQTDPPHRSVRVARSVSGLLILLLAISLFTTNAAATDIEGTTIIVGINEDFPPFDYTDYSGRPTGFIVDIIDAVSDEMGFNIAYKTGEWQELRDDLDAGRIDIIGGMYYSEERDEEINFSKPYLTVSHAIYVQDGSGIKGLDDLPGLRITVQEGDIMHEFLQENENSYTIITTPSQEEALKLIAEGESDAALLSHIHGDYLIGENGLSDISTVGPPLERRDYCIAASANGSHYLPDLNEGLAIIKANGRYDEIYDKWFGVYEARDFFATLIDIILYILLPIIVLLAAALLWSLKLRERLSKTSGELEEELELQKRMRNALKESKDKYHILFNSINESVFLCEFSEDTKSERIIEVNDTTCSSLGYTREDLLEMNTSDIIDIPMSKRKPYLSRIQNGEQLSYYSSMKRKDGTEFPAHIKARILWYDGSKCIIRLVRDISYEVENRRLEKEALMQIEQNLSQLAILNDEIRNPLAVIVGVADMELDNSTEIILEQSKAIDEIINRLDKGWLESAKIREYMKKHLEMDEVPEENKE